MPAVLVSALPVLRQITQQRAGFCGEVRESATAGGALRRAKGAATNAPAARGATRRVIERLNTTVDYRTRT
jgi:hypothetical protein